MMPMSPGSSMNHVQVTGPRQKLYGIVPVRIGSKHMVNGVELETHERARFVKVKTKHRCLTCAKDFDSYEALVQGHPTHDEMVKAQQTHIFALWSSEPLKSTPTPILGLPPEGQPKHEDPPIGLLSDFR